MKVRVHTDKGFTDCDFDAFAAAEPKLQEIRDKLEAGEINGDQVLDLVRPLFGPERHNKDFWKVVGESRGTEAINKWDTWFAEKGNAKLYYSAETVAGCVKLTVGGKNV